MRRDVVVVNTLQNLFVRLYRTFHRIVDALIASFVYIRQ